MRIDARKAGTKLPRILAAALRLFVEKGVDGTTTKEIAQAAGVAEGAFYRHYPSKDALAFAIYEENLEDLSARLAMEVRPERSLGANLEALIVVLFSCYESEPLLARYLLFAQFREMARFPRGYRYPSESFKAAILLVASDRGWSEADVNLRTAMAFGAVVRCIVFRMFGELDDLQDLAPEVARRAEAMAA